MALKKFLMLWFLKFSYYKQGNNCDTKEMFKTLFINNLLFVFHDAYYEILEPAPNST